MSENNRLDENGIYNRNILSEAIYAKRELKKSIDSLGRIYAEKYNIVSPSYSDMPKGGTLEDVHFSERVEAKEKEIEVNEKKLEIAKLNVDQKISDLALSDDKKKLLRKCFVDLQSREKSFVDCNMSITNGYRKYREILNSINFKSW